MPKAYDWTFVIDRSRWKTATHGEGYTRLLNKEGFQCCLGFACEQLGVPRRRLRDALTPSGVYQLETIIRGRKNLDPLVTCEGECSAFAEVAMQVNDKIGIDNRTRERQLIELGKKHRVRFVFRGKYRREATKAAKHED